MVFEPFTFWPLLGKQNKGSLRNSTQGSLNGSLSHQPPPVPGTRFRDEGQEEVPQSTGRPAIAPGNLPALSISGWSGRDMQHLEPVWFTHMAPSHRSDQPCASQLDLGPEPLEISAEVGKLSWEFHQILLALVSQQQLQPYLTCFSCLPTQFFIGVPIPYNICQ